MAEIWGNSTIFIAKKLEDMNFEILATKGTYKALRSNNIKTQLVGKIGEGHSEILDYICQGQIQLVINTPSGERSQSDSKPIRNAAVMRGIPCITTISGAQAAVNGIEATLNNDFQVKSIQEYLSYPVGHCMATHGVG